ncbi:hypothetical protein GMSM_34060 [Geomonas sp. Red276]
MRIAAIALISIILCGIPCRSFAALKTLEEGELARVSGRAGISIDTDLGMMVSAGSISISDTSSTPNWLTLKGVTVDDGAGGNFLVRTSDGTTPNPSTIGIVTDASGQPTLVVTDTSRTNPRYYNVESIEFAGQELGSLRIGPVTEGPSTLAISSLNGSGVKFDYTTKADIGAFRYGYNLTDAFTLSGIHFAASAAGAPEAPSSWVMSGNFHVGNAPSSGDAPAYFTAGTDQNGVASTNLNIPAQGSIRVEDLSFGSTSFGPMAIDGISVHRMNVRFTP